MRRKLVLPSVLFLSVLLLAPLGAARGEDADQIPRDIEIMIREMEGLLLDLSGARDVKPVFKRHRDGLYSLSVRLPKDSPLLTAGAAAKPLTTLAAGHMLSEPSSQSTLINAVRSTVGFDYHFWWVALNTSDDFLTRKTTNSVKGPGPDINRSDTVTYDPTSTHLFWFEAEDAFQDVGLFTRKTKVTKAGAVKYKLFAD